MCHRKCIYAVTVAPRSQVTDLSSKSEEAICLILLVQKPNKVICGLLNVETIYSMNIEEPLTAFEGFSLKIFGKHPSVSVNLQEGEH